MEKQLGAFLIVEKGDPYGKGETLQLAGDSVLLGRRWGDHQPDLSFTRPYVSRSHATIAYEDGRYTLTDLSTSKHGTKVNGRRLERGAPCQLNHGDRIGLAEDEVVLVFWAGLEAGETLDFPARKGTATLVINDERKEVLLEGRPIELKGKPYDLLYLLYRRRGRVVSRGEIKNEVWPERDRDDRGAALVGDEEVATLVHRLREQLGQHGRLVRNIRPYGYMLDTPP